MKTCKACGRTLPIDDFYRSGNSRFARCIACFNRAKREERAEARAARVPRPPEFKPRSCANCATIFQPTGSRDRWCSAICSLWDHVPQLGPSECWPAALRPQKSGHVMMMVRGEKFYAHRLVCEATHGLLADGECATHSCDNPPCCNPDHVRPGTPTSNSQEAHDRGRRIAVNYATGDRHGRSRKAA